VKAQSAITAARHRAIRSQSGVGMLEVLIALLVVALGVVTMSGLQLKTMSLVMDSTQRSYVIAKSQDIADRIRSNTVPASNYYDQAGVVYNNNFSYCVAAPPQVCSDNMASGDVLAGCTDPQMAAFDLFDAFCTGDGSLEGQVADWQVSISCVDAAGIVVNTPNCAGLGERVEIVTTWHARSAIATGAAGAAEQDTLTLRFVR